MDTTWPQWRGPGRDNISLCQGLADRWPAEGPPLVWQLNGVGAGMSPIISDEDRLYTVGGYGDRQYLLAIDPESGEGIWATEIGPYANFDQKNKVFVFMKWLTQRCPTVDGDRLFFLGDGGDLVCLRSDNGKELWRVNYESEFSSEASIWGYCDYPLVDSNQVIIAPAGTNGTVAALNRKSGEVLWRCQIPDAENRGNAAIQLAKLGGVSQYVVVIGNDVVGVSPQQGEVLWRFRRDYRVAGNWYTPLISGDFIFVPLGYFGRMNLLKIETAGGKPKLREVYTGEGLGRVQHFQDSTVRFGDIAILVSLRHLVRVNWRTAETLPGRLRLNAGKYAFFVAGEGKLFVSGSSGDVLLVKADGENLEEISRFRIADSQMEGGVTAPTIANGRLYIRDGDRIFCFDVTGDANARRDPEPRNVLFNTQLLRPQPNLTRSSNPEKSLDAPFVPTPDRVVTRMLEAAALNEGDLLYDLGSGDGRFLIAAAKENDCRAVGIEMDERLVKLSRERVSREQVGDLVTVIQGDMFEEDFDDATVVVTYLYPNLLKRLVPKLNQLKPGSRIVSYQYRIPGQSPERTIDVSLEDSSSTDTIYVYQVPLKPDR